MYVYGIFKSADNIRCIDVSGNFVGRPADELVCLCVSSEAAERRKIELQKQSDTDVKTLGCDPEEYFCKAILVTE